MAVTVAVMVLSVLALGFSSAHPQSLIKTAAEKVKGDWPCPGENTVCFGGPLTCCPGPNMKCCGTNRQYCCAQDEECSTDGTNNCVKQDRASATVVCPNNKDTCPEGSTCCETKDQGVYGCCPIANGVCCQDQDYQRCCTYGYMCGQGFGHCRPF